MLRSDSINFTHVYISRTAFFAPFIEPSSVPFVAYFQKHPNYAYTAIHSLISIICLDLSFPWVYLLWYCLIMVDGSVTNSWSTISFFLAYFLLQKLVCSLQTQQFHSIDRNIPFSNTEQIRTSCHNFRCSFFDEPSFHIIEKITFKKHTSIFLTNSSLSCFNFLFSSSKSLYFVISTDPTWPTDDATYTISFRSQDPSISTQSCEDLPAMSQTIVVTSLYRFYHPQSLYTHPFYHLDHYWMLYSGAQSSVGYFSSIHSYHPPTFLLMHYGHRKNQMNHTPFPSQCYQSASGDDSRKNLVHVLISSPIQSWTPDSIRVVQFESKIRCADVFEGYSSMPLLLDQCWKLNW